MQSPPASSPLLVQFIHWLEPVSVLITVVGLPIAAYQLWDARRVTRELQTISKSMSTQFLGAFPAFLPDLVRTIDEAHSRLLILCDVPSYAVFTDPKAWLKYKAAIEQKLEEGVDVSFVCLSEERRLELHDEEFSAASRDWVDWRQRNLPTIRSFLKHRSVTVNENTLTAEDLREELSKSHAETLATAFRRANTLRTHDLSPISCWVIDNKAMFTIRDFGKGATEYGFVTSDDRLIRAFVGIHADARRRAQSHQPDAA